MADKTFTIREGITINEEVILAIAGLGALEVEGVDTLTGGINNKLLPKAGMSKLSKAIRLIHEDNGMLSIQIILSVKYGYSIMKVTEAVQEKVKSSVENMTDLKIKAVDVKVSTVIINSTSAK
ncbi:MAG: Asp23/Gls24 family envelope stress response protein [Lachnospiraceae bacterium]|jgi:uncharacterized alkaline shock family protein YloU|nr:Asp23/Gls24 family envelope stress response protein [Lachnospiraceae bacterium]